jgi:spore germination cell wall hydrolase CwlJ-like protein
LARAAGFAAAAFGVAFTATYSPSLAWEYEAAPAAAAYQDHLAAAPEGSAGQDIPVAQALPIFDPNLTPDVAAHAVAQAAPEPVEEEEPKRSLAQLVAGYASADASDSEHECLAGAVYFESKGEPLQGQLAVAEVILNRAASGKFPKSICGVVKQKSQFSFVRGGRIPSISKSSEAWRKAVAIAHIAKQDLAEGGIGKAMFFHARYVSPRWRLTRVASIGNHIFYR